MLARVCDIKVKSRLTIARVSWAKCYTDVYEAPTHLLRPHLVRLRIHSGHARDTDMRRGHAKILTWLVPLIFLWETLGTHEGHV